MKLFPVSRCAVVLIAFALNIFSANAAKLPALPPVALPVIPKTVVKLTDCGGVADGETLNTAAFEKALVALAEKGGGELIVPPGFWLTGPIHLRSQINLHLERGALIQFSGDYNLYPLAVTDLKGEKEVDSMSPISGVNLENVAITGDGIIDGGGEAWRSLKREKLGDRDWKALVKSGGVLNDKGDSILNTGENALSIATTAASAALAAGQIGASGGPPGGFTG